ncbi:MAG: hypothetical protein OFPII_29910 [Osedax symbiont Rs1]|nr:MAG: hypothetical protein OFPII_29910 [Osedax symbiont Rs1]
MWIEVFGKADKDAEELLKRLNFMFNNVKSHKEKGTDYDVKIVKFLEAWGMNKQDNPDKYLINIDLMWRFVNRGLSHMRQALYDKQPSSALARIDHLGESFNYFEEVLHLRSPESNSLELKNDYLFSVVSLLVSHTYEIGTINSQIFDLDQIDQSLINELNISNPWAKYGTKP